MLVAQKICNICDARGIFWWDVISWQSKSKLQAVWFSSSQFSSFQFNSSKPCLVPTPILKWRQYHQFSRDVKTLPNQSAVYLCGNPTILTGMWYPSDFGVLGWEKSWLVEYSMVLFSCTSVPSERLQIVSGGKQPSYILCIMCNRGCIDGVVCRETYDTQSTHCSPAMRSASPELVWQLHVWDMRTDPTYCM